MTVPTKSLVASILVITFGCALAALAEVGSTGGSTLFGLAVFFCSELAECVRVVILQFLLEGRSDVELNAISLLYYVTPYAFIWCQVFAAFLEYVSFWQGGFKIMSKVPLAFSVAAALGFGVNVFAFLVIQTAQGGSLTFKLAQVAKNALLVVASAYIFAYNIDSIVQIGYGVTLVGCLWYTVLSMEKDRKPSQPSPVDSHIVGRECNAESQSSS
jgi:hypothetical protein